MKIRTDQAPGFFFANSALMVPINIFDDKVAEKAIERDNCTCYF